MGLRLLIVLTSLVAAVSTCRAAIERVVEKTFPASENTSVVVNLFAGGISVSTGERPEIRVRLRETFATDSESDADRRLKRVELAIEEKNGVVAVSAKAARTFRWGWEDWPPFGLMVEIEVPRTGARLDLTTAEGDITIGNVRSVLRASAEHGTIFAFEIEGDLTAKTGDGDVAVTACSGDLHIETSKGGIQAGRTGKSARLTTAGGSIDVQTIRGPVRAVAGGGDIKLGFAQAWTGGAEAISQGGEISVALDARTAVTIDAEAAVGGNVRVRGLELETVEGAAGQRRLVARQAGGGPAISLRGGSRVRINHVPAGP